jgi:hypothetical protein
MSFDQYEFVSTLEKEIKDKIQKGEFGEYYDIQEFINEEIETACIYYSDCFDIIKALNFTDFNNSSFEITNVAEAAACALSEFLLERLDWQEFDKTINT